MKVGRSPSASRQDKALTAVRFLRHMSRYVDKYNIHATNNITIEHTIGKEIYEKSAENSRSLLHRYRNTRVSMSSVRRVSHAHVYNNR